MIVTPDPLSKSEKTKLNKWVDTYDETMSKWAAEVQRHRVPWVTTVNWNEERSTGAMHASSINHGCDMFLYLERMGAKGIQKMPPRPRKIMDAGTMFHELMHYYHGTRALHHNYAYHPEVRIHPDVNQIAKHFHICGHCDGILKGWPLKRPILTEYKTIGKKGIGSLTKPSRDYVKQAHVYMVCLQIPVSAITYVVKDSVDFHTYLMHFQPGIWHEIEARVQRTNALAEKITEDAPRRVTSSCRYCPYFEECGPRLPKQDRKTGLPEVGHAKKRR